MVDPEETTQIRAYLEQHHTTYTRETLRRQLLAGGYTPAAVDQVMTEVYGTADRETGGSASGRPPPGYYLLVSALLFLNVLGAPALLKYVYEAQGWWPPWAPPYGLIVWLGPLELGIAWLLRRMGGAPWIERGIHRAAVLYLVLIPVWVGTCLALVGQNIAG